MGSTWQETLEEHDYDFQAASEAWDGGDGADAGGPSLDGIGIGRDSAAFSRAEPTDDSEPGRYTGTVKYRPDGSVIESPAGEETPDDPEPTPDAGGSSKGGDR